jgi:hypothetical protein
MNDDHVADCPQCGTLIKEQLFSPPQVKYNKGGFSIMTGKPYKSITDLDEQMHRIYHDNDISEHLHDTVKPKDQWIEEKYYKDEAQLESQKDVDEWHNKTGHYDSIETFDPDKL